MNLTYLLNQKVPLSISSCDKQWDIYISAYNDSDRVRNVHQKINAREKYWVMLPEYGYSPEEGSELSGVIWINAPIANEADVVQRIFAEINFRGKDERRLCIDMTGFMRPHILYLVSYLASIGPISVDFIYTEPEQYLRKEHTAFSNEEIETVRQVIGYEGVHEDEDGQNILVIGVGYDDALISRVSNDKVGAQVFHLLSLPSLSADMYQESILRLDKLDASFDQNLEDRTFFAPANDPYVIASELSEKYLSLKARWPNPNLYLCPLATKPQALGFALFYINELVGLSASILFPFCTRYERETSKGVGRTWRYSVQLERA